MMGTVRRNWNRFIVADRRHLVRRGFLALGVAFVASYVLGALFWATFSAFYGVCGDLAAKECGPKPASVYAPGYALLALTVLLSLFCLVCVVRALVLFALAALKHYRDKQG